MSILIRNALVSVALVSLFFCANAKRDVYNRARDLGDIINLGLEKNTYGFQASFLYTTPLATKSSSGVGLGVRHGHFGFYRTGDDKNAVRAEIEATGEEMFSLNLGDSVIIWPSFYHEPIGNANFRNLAKKYKVVLMGRCIGKPPEYRKPLSLYYKGSKFRCGKIESPFEPFYTFELSVGIYFGFRIGINFSEIFDFIGGFAGFDPMDDDISNTEPIYREFPLPITEKKDWESKVDALDEKMDKRLTK